MAKSVSPWPVMAAARATRALMSGFRRKCILSLSAVLTFFAFANVIVSLLDAKWQSATRIMAGSLNRIQVELLSRYRFGFQRMDTEANHHRLSSTLECAVLSIRQGGTSHAACVR